MTLLSPMMTKQQLCAELGISELALTKFRQRYANMPSPIKLGQRIYWRREDIEAWIRAFLPAAKNKKGAA